MGLRFTAEAEAYLRVLAPKPKHDIRKAIDLIREDPLHPDLDWKPLRKKSTFRFLRARVGLYRIIYTPRPGTTYIWRVQHRRDGYGWLDLFDPWP